MNRYILIILFFLAGSFAELAGQQVDTVIVLRDTLPVQAVAPDSAVTVKSTVAEHANQQVQDTTRSGLLSEVGEDVSEKPKDVLKSISLSKIFWTIVLLIIGYYLVKLFVSIFTLIAEKSTRLRITIKGIIPVIRIVIWSIIIFAIVKGIFNPPIQTVIAVTASVGIAVGLAAQDLLKNVFGGMALLLDRPFLVGDKIDTGNHYGEVIEIGLRATRIVTPDDSVVSVPNAELINSAVSNSNSGELNCQVVAEIYLPIDVDTQVVRKIAIEAAQVSKFIYLKKPIVVLFFNEVKERRSYLKMRLKAYVMDIRYEFQFKSDLTEIVIRELLKAKVISREDLF